MIPVGIVGFSGYSGAELVNILSRHPHVEPVLLEHREEEPSNFSVPRRLPYSADTGLPLVFLATPPEVSIELAPALLDAGSKVIDLSGAFRLGTVENYQRWYKAAHPRPDLLAEAAYGLPEFYRSTIPGKRLIANPGCYPTAANLALRPLLEAGVIDRTAGIVCDAKSGVSGAGRKPTLKTSFCEVTDNFSAYSVLEHRHVPEILRTSGLEEAELSFTAQLLPIERGILETIYFRALNDHNFVKIYLDRYLNEHFVRIYPEGRFPDLRAVARTNFCDIGVHVDAKTGRGVVVVAIDNLIKGAAGMAVQNMNLAMGFPETAGLL
ncbi:MAG: N-acetyl-gamma-glutamyl-phosphate reductase [Bryobacteraceae bacterium]